MLPTHTCFVEVFAGGAAVTRHKRPSERTVLIERDPQRALALRAAMRDRDGVTVIVGDALRILQPPEAMGPGSVLYCDPPYVMSARKTQRKYYRHDWTDADHVRFLEWVQRFTCPVLISGYWSQLYAAVLDPKRWRVESFTVGTRGGRAVEHVWCNFPVPRVLHDPQHVGGSFTDRQRVRRKAARWARMLAAMPAAERAAVYEAVAASMRACIDAGDGTAG
jgi:site-specific DNA-adenine methylase